MKLIVEVDLDWIDGWNPTEDRMVFRQMEAVLLTAMTTGQVSMPPQLGGLQFLDAFRKGYEAALASKTKEKP